MLPTLPQNIKHVSQSLPLPKDDPLYDAKNIILTPHISGNMSLDYTCQLDVDLFVQNLKLYVEGKPLPHLIDRKIGY